MSYEFFPPELNSFLIMSGPGSAPLLAAAAAWEGLAEELETTAMGVGSVIAGVGADWQGPASSAMQTKLAPHVAWLHQTAAQAATTGAALGTHAGLYEQARNTSVPLPAVLANRILLSALEATNILGQNTPLIAACEAAYEVMWATDVFAMKTYDFASRSLDSLGNGAIPPPPGAPVARTLSGGSGSGPLDGVKDFASGVGDQFTSLTSGLSLDSIGATLNGLPIVGEFTSLTNPDVLFSAAGFSTASELANGPVRLMSTPMSMLMQLSRGGSSGTGGLSGLTSGTGAGTNPLLDAIGEMVNGKLQTMTGGLTNQLSSWGSQIGQQVSAQLSNASRIGGLSVPDGAIQSITRALPVPPATTVSAVPTVSAGMPGGPFAQAMMGALAGRGFGGLGTVAKAGVKAAASAKGG